MAHTKELNNDIKARRKLVTAALLAGLEDSVPGLLEIAVDGTHQGSKVTTRDRINAIKLLTDVTIGTKATVDSTDDVTIHVDFD